MRRERQRAEYMARAAAWQLEKEEAEEAKVSQPLADHSPQTADHEHAYDAWHSQCVCLV